MIPIGQAQTHQQCRPVDSGELARRLDQLERRVDDLSSGVARREPIKAERPPAAVMEELRKTQRAQPLDVMDKGNFTLRKNISRDFRGPITFIRVNIDVANALLQDGWQLADA